MVLSKNIGWLVLKHRLSSIANIAAPSMAAHIPIVHSTAELLAIEHLKSGSVIAIPTDTVYGLLCDATNSFAVDRLYTIKCRNENEPLAIRLAEISETKSWASVQLLSHNLLNILLPGLVTLILTCASANLDKLLGLNCKISIRIPDYSFMKYLTRGLGKPLTSTSANVSNKPSAVDISCFSGIWDRILVVFDAGSLEASHSTSIVDLYEWGSYLILRGHTRKLSTYYKTGLKSNY